MNVINELLYNMMNKLRTLTLTLLKTTKTLEIYFENISSFFDTGRVWVK